MEQNSNDIVTQQWHRLLTQWNTVALSTPIAASLPPAIAQSRWFGSPPATDSALRAVERRFRITFPPSYRAFLLVSNGWRFPSLTVERQALPIWMNGEVDRLYSVEAVQRFRTEHADLIRNWWTWNTIDDSDEDDEDYWSIDPFLRGRDMAPKSHARAAFSIGTVGDSMLLLNPKRVQPNGEWEAWEFSAIGPFRHRSFLTLMEYQLQRYQEAVQGYWKV